MIGPSEALAALFSETSGSFTSVASAEDWADVGSAADEADAGLAADEVDTGLAADAAGAVGREGSLSSDARRHAAVVSIIANISRMDKIFRILCLFINIIQFYLFAKTLQHRRELRPDGARAGIEQIAGFAEDNAVRC